MKKQYIITLLIILFSIISHAQVVGFGDGSDGLVTISTSNVVVNEYRKITNVSGNIVSEYNVTSSTPFNTNFSIGKCVLLINMVTGDYHFDKVYHYTTNILTLWNVQNVDLSVFGDSSQILNVPMYQNLTVNSGGQLTCQPWNSATGTGRRIIFSCKRDYSL
jgi:hypothetical protein